MQTLYIGCQNTSLQWFNFKKNSVPPVHSRDEEKSADHFEQVSQELTEVINSKKYQRHRFFDSLPQPEGRPQNNSRLNSGLATPGSDHTDDASPHEGVLQVEGCCVVDSAHYGYIYSMVILSKDVYMHQGSKEEEVTLVTGSGDETVKVCIQFLYII